MTLFDPLYSPFKGLRTYTASSGIPPGYWKEAKNIRVDTQAIALRLGQTLVLNASSLSATSCVGSHLVVYGTVAYYYVALNFSGTVRIYVNQYTIATSTWGGFVEVTAASGQYGNTRMSLATRGLFSFTTVSGQYTSEPITIVQNGVDTPRVIKGTTVANAAAISAPTDVTSYKPVFGFAANLDITAASTATNSTGARFAASTTGSVAHWLWTFTTPTVGDTAQLVKDSGNISLANSKQFIILANASSEDLINGCKWELVTASGGPFTIHDPSVGLNTLVSSETDIPGVRMYGFSVQEHAGSISQVRGVKLTVTNAGITTGGTIAIYGFHAGGKVPGFAQYGLAYRHSVSQCESAGIVYDFPSQAADLTTVWGATTPPTAVQDQKFSYPLSESFYYQVTVPVLRSNSTDRDAGVDNADLYRKDPGENQFLLVESLIQAAYAGSWAYSANFTNARYNYSDTVDSEFRDDRYTLPSDFNESIPISSSGLSSNNRTYFGTNKVSSNPFNSVKVSQYGFPCRFSAQPNPDQLFDTSFLAEFDTDEIVAGFKASSSSFIGNSQIYAYTSKGTYSIDGPIIRRISSVGSIAGHSIAESQGRMFWLDQDLSIRRSDGSISDISRLRIDDLLTGATATDKISAAFHRDRYYFAYSGGVLVWSELLQDWESLDVPGVQPIVFLPWRVNNESKLYFTSANGSLYQYEAGTTDASAQILISLQTPDFHGPSWERIEAGQTKIVCSDKNSETMTVLYTAQSPTGTQTGTINLDAGGSETTLWRQDKQSTGGDTGITGCSLNVKLSATLEGPFVIQAIVVDKLKGTRGVGHSA